MAKRTFENALNRLEKITEELETGDLSLDASLKKFDEGVKLVAYCSETLEEARARIDLLVKDGDTLQSEPFPDPETGD